VLPNGTTFLEAIARAATDAGADPVVVVLPTGSRAPRGTHAVINPDSTSEQIASLRLGLEQLADSAVDGALVWPVDCPLVRPETAVALLHAARASGAPVAIPVNGGRRGHPTYFARAVWPELMTATEGGARQVVRRREAELIEVPVDDAAILTDVDTKADLVRMTERSVR
jgi:CTP:molybdopterin cytidylyltransferase MocA